MPPSIDAGDVALATSSVAEVAARRASALSAKQPALIFARCGLMTSVIRCDTVRDNFRDRMPAALPQLQIHTALRADDVGACVADADALFAFGPSLDDRFIQRAHGLKWLQFLSSGTDTLARLPSLGAGVIVTSTLGVEECAVVGRRRAKAGPSRR